MSGSGSVDRTERRDRTERLFFFSRDHSGYSGPCLISLVGHMYSEYILNSVALQKVNQCVSLFLTCLGTLSLFCGGN